METSERSQGHLIAGAGGVALIVLLFFPWVSIEGLDNLSGWQLFTVGDIFFLITGVAAIQAAITGGRLLPGLSLYGTAALLGSVATVLLLWLLIFDWPDGTSRMIWAFLALIAAAAIAVGGYLATQDEGT